MELTYQDYLTILKEIRQQTDFEPEIGVVLGTGLGNFANEIQVEKVIPYSQLSKMPKPTNSNHSGEFIFGYLNGIKVVLMKGRIHYYEGYSTQTCVVPIRLLGMLKIKTLILTNAAGGVNFSFNPGDFMMIEDHISAFVPSPLRGTNFEEFGTRFPDMSNIYDAELTQKIYQRGKELNLPMQKGVYLQFPGPQFESKAEIKAFRGLGADAVGMSTVIEAIASNHMNIKTVGISFISNLACGMSKRKITDEEVIEEAKTSEKNLITILKEAIQISHDK